MTRSIVYGANVDIDMGANPITNVEDPTNDQDAATKKYVDDNAGGATFGTPAIVLGTAAGNGSVDEAIRRDSTIVAFDATAPSTQAFGDAAATGSAAVAARRDHKHAMPANPFVGASAGGVLDGTYPNPGLAAGVAGAGLAETSDVLSVNVDGSTIEIATDTLQLKDGGVTSAKIANGTIVDADVNASAAVAYSKLALATSLVAGDLSAALTTSLQPWTVVTKSGSDTSRQSTTSMTADPDLVATFASGGYYEWEIFGAYVCGSGAGSPGFKIGFGEDGTSRGQGSVLWYLTTGAAPTAITVYDCAPSVVAGVGLLANDTTVRPFVFRGKYTGNGASAGLWWAQVSSVARDVTVKGGGLSILRYRRIS